MSVYYIVRPVSDVFYFVPETILPWAILCIIWIRLRFLRGDQGVTRAVRGTAIGFLSLLTALSVAITAMDITITVYYINWDDDNYLALSNAWYGLYITHVTLRVLAALIATALATNLFFDSRNSTKPSKVKHRYSYIPNRSSSLTFRSDPHFPPRSGNALVPRTRNHHARFRGNQLPRRL